MPRHKEQRVSRGNVDIDRFVKSFVRDAREANLDCDAFEASLFRVLTRAAEEAAAELKTRAAAPKKSAKKGRPKR